MIKSEIRSFSNLFFAPNLKILQNFNNFLKVSQTQKNPNGFVQPQFPHQLFPYIQHSGYRWIINQDSKFAKVNEIIVLN